MKRFSMALCITSCLFLAVPESKAINPCGVAGNLVANCGFETGDFTSWTISGNDAPGELGNLYGVEGVDPDGTSPHGGSNQAYIGDLTSNALTLEQTISTVATDSYTVSFWLAQDAASTTPYPNELDASFGGTTLVDEGVPLEGYTQFSYVVAATSSSSILSLTLGNDLGYFELDDLSVVLDTTSPATTPEPPAWVLMLGGLLGLPLLRRRVLQGAV
jgi:MYXO-CTERM domain-containing protein